MLQSSNAEPPSINVKDMTKIKKKLDKQVKDNPLLLTRYIVVKDVTDFMNVIGAKVEEKEISTNPSGLPIMFGTEVREDKKMLSKHVAYFDKDNKLLKIEKYR